MATLVDNNDGTASIDLDAAGVFTDSDGTIASYSVATSDAAVATASISGTTLTISAQADGTCNITVTATDNDGATVDDVIGITVSTGGGAVKPSFDPATFDKTALTATYEAIFDKAAFVIPFAEGSGTTVKDLVSGTDCNIVNGLSDGQGPSWDTDAEGVHLSWPNTNQDRYVDLSPLSLGTVDDITLFAVVRPDDVTLSDDGYIWYYPVSGPGIALVSIAVADDPGFVGDARLFFDDDSGAADDRVYGAPIVDGNVHTLLGTRSGSTVRIRVDGAEASENAVGTSTLAADDGPYIGCDPGGGEQFVGDMYLLVGFMQTLTSQEESDLEANKYGLIDTGA